MSASTPAETLIAERYQLKRRLAQGGMAEVWLAVDLTLDRKVAVKWLKPMLASDEVVAERFRREAIAAASLNHPNIVAVHDVFEHEGRQAVVMQLVDGKSLRQLLDTQKRLSPELTGHIGACTAAALHNAHENNFVHRDVKPGNIMITPDGRVLLTDFGIAKALAGGDDLTSENIMMGTAKYLSPEQVRGKKLDGRADLYSLGLVLYECLAGRVPFLGETDADTALARLQRDPTDLTRLRPTLPTSLVAIIHQLLARNPAHRPATGADLVAALEAAANEPPPLIDDTPHEPSPVTPYSVGKLRRAPSDTDSRGTSRESPATGTRRDNTPGRSRRSGQTPVVDGGRQPVIPVTAPATPPNSANRAMPEPRRIPGEPQPITGAVPVQSARPAEKSAPRQHTPPRNQPGDQPATPARRSRRDPTPSAGAAQRGRPAKGMSQEIKPSLTVLGGLLLLAAIVALALWMSVAFGGDGPSTAPSTVLPPGATDSPANNADLAPGLDPDNNPDQPADGAQVPDSAAPGAGSIASIEAYDPDGDNEENDDEAVLALADGNPSTNWRTVCYGGEFMGGKRGVGLVVTLDGFAQRALTVDVINGPYILDFFTSANENVPATLDGWDSQLGSRAFAAEGEVVSSAVPPSPVLHMLVLLKQVGPDSSCTGNNPFRGRLDEIALI